MAQEIERKYLIQDETWKEGLTEADSTFIQQAYLNADPDRVIRVRIRDNRSYLTIKSRSQGISRSEYEYSIPLKDGEELLDMGLGQIILKRRYEIDFKGKTWEVDEFLGKHEGLVLAEIELDSEEETFVKPPWLGKEVSGDPAYSNMNLALG